MGRVVHFEIPAENLERAREFYTEVFDWKIEKWEGPMDYLLVTTGPDDQPGINGAIMKRTSPTTGEGKTAFICTVGVESIDESLEKVQSTGGGIETEKTEIPQVGIFAYCRDTEGNTFGLLEPKM